MAWRTVKMSKQVPWNKIILEEFIELACLSNTEEMIMRTRVKGWSITEQSHKLHMSESSIKRIIARLKVKYDNVQEYSPILPKRKASAVETWMDEHWGVLGLLFFYLPKNTLFCSFLANCQKKYMILQFSCKITYKKSKFLHILHFKPYQTIFPLHFLCLKNVLFLHLISPY